MIIFRRSAAMAAASCFAILCPSALAQTPSPVEEVQAMNVRLVAGVADAALLEKRAEVLGKIIETDPAAAVELLLPEELARQIREQVPQSAWLVERQGMWEGLAGVMVEDHFDTGVSHTRNLLSAGSEELELFSAEDRTRVLPGQQLLVRGTRLGTRLLATEVQTVSAATDSCSTTGEQHIAVIFVETPSYKLLPSLGYPDEVRDMLTNPTDLSTQGFLSDVSYGRISSKILFSRTYQLSRNYIPDYSGEQTLILSEMMTQADKDIDFSYYNRIFVVMAYPPMSGQTGLATMGCTRQVTSRVRETCGSLPPS